MSEPESNEYVLYDEVMMNWYDQMEHNEENDLYPDILLSDEVMMMSYDEAPASQLASQAARLGHIAEHQQASDELQQSEEFNEKDDEWMIGYSMEYDEPNDLCRQVSQPASQPGQGMP